jgi:hypothetical protein
VWQVTPAAARLAGGGDAAPLVRPIRRGVVQDWDALESIYHHIFYEQVRRTHVSCLRRVERAPERCAVSLPHPQLGWVMGEEGSVLVAEPLLTSKARARCVA